MELRHRRPASLEETASLSGSKASEKVQPFAKRSEELRDMARHAGEKALKAHSDDEGAMQRKRQSALNQLAENEDWLAGRLTSDRDPRGDRMRDNARREKARLTAEVYAPRPQDGYLMYVLVGIGVALLALFAFSRFYDVDLSTHQMGAIAAIAFACAAALILRHVRQRRHNTAFRIEYDQTSPD